ncbi:MAG: AAA family ATPase [Phycisphaerales bacterium]
MKTAEDVRVACSIIKAGFSKMRREVSKVIVGQERVVDLVLVAIFANGHVLLEGPPGLGKTLLVRTMGDVMQLSMGRIQCTADLMPADIVGTTIVDEDPITNARRFTFHKGPVFNQLLLADEINRATPKCQSALLESMQEHSVSIDGKTRLLPDPFFVLATQNPIEQEGTYPLPEAQLDRFMFKIDVGNASQEDLYEIVIRTTGGVHVDADVIVQGDFILATQQIIRHVVIAPHVQDYVTRLVLATHAGSAFAPNWVQDSISIGASPRGAQAIVSTSKVAAVVDGRFAVSMRDIQAVAIPALQHRVARTFEAETASRSTSSMIARLLEEVPFFEEGVK